MTDKPLSEQASVAADVGNIKRSIQMKMFASKTQKAELALQKTKTPDAEVQLVLGQVIGQIFKVSEKEGQLPDGTSKKSLLAIGEFEATNYHTGEIWNSNAIYLPEYYLETMKAALEVRDTPSMLFAIEIVLVATGKEIPVAYEVRNIVQRRPDNPLNLIKQELMAQGRLRLPPPPSKVGAIADEVRQIEAVVDGPDEGGDEGEENPPASAAHHKKGK